MLMFDVLHTLCLNIFEFLCDVGIDLVHVLSHSFHYRFFKQMRLVKLVVGGSNQTLLFSAKSSLLCWVRVSYSWFWRISILRASISWWKDYRTHIQVSITATVFSMSPAAISAVKPLLPSPHTILRSSRRRISLLLSIVNSKLLVQEFNTKTVPFWIYRYILHFVPRHG